MMYFFHKFIQDGLNSLFLFSVYTCRNLFFLCYFYIISVKFRQTLCWDLSLKLCHLLQAYPVFATISFSTILLSESLINLIFINFPTMQILTFLPLKYKCYFHCMSTENQKSGLESFMLISQEHQ